MKKNFYTIIFLVAIVFLPSLTFAQVEVAKRVALTASPENPAPGETVNLSVSSSEVPVDLATIEWFVDGKSMKKGVGMKTFSFVAGSNGKSNTVSVRITPQSGAVVEQSMTFSPADMDLIWEAVGAYVPPFYKGKTLPIKQGQVKVVAIPVVRDSKGVMLKPSNFAYAWRKDGQSIEGQSGFGQSDFTFVNQMLETTNRIDISATNGAKGVQGSLSMNYFEPELLFYESDNQTGVQYQNALQSGFRPKFSNIAIALEPYFLPKAWRTDLNTTVEWKLNGQKVNPKDKGNLIVNIDKSAGSFTVGALYKETKKLFRNYSKSVTIAP